MFLEGDSSMKNNETPVRPPRKGRTKSDTSLGGNDSSYDHLWVPRKDQKEEDKEEDHAYSLLGSDNAEVYDNVSEGSDRGVVLNSSPVNDDQWIEDGRRFDSQGK